MLVQEQRILRRREVRYVDLDGVIKRLSGSDGDWSLCVRQP